MFYRSHLPAPPLDQYIEWFWYCEGVPEYARARILLSGTVELVLNLRDDEVRLDGPVRRRLSGAVASGAYGRFLVVDPMQHASMIGVHFKPGGAAPFLGTLGDLTDAHADLETVWAVRRRASRAALRRRHAGGALRHSGADAPSSADPRARPPPGGAGRAGRVRATGGARA